MAKPRPRLISLVNEIAELVRGRKQVKISVLALRFGYSRHYFKYHIVPVITDLFDDIKLVRINGTEYLVSASDSKQSGE